MARTIRILVEDDVHAGLRRRALEAGVSVSELLRSELTRLAAERPAGRRGPARPDCAAVDAWLADLPQAPAAVDAPPGWSAEALDELRGPWPDADG